MVSMSLLKPSPTNPRKHFDQAKLVELAESMKKHGVLQPIVARPVGAHYEIVAGERRFRAAKIAELTEVPVSLRELSDTDTLEIQVIENLQRSDLHSLEEAEGYRQLLKIPGYDAARIAERVGRSAKYVYDRIKLLNLIEPLRKVFMEGMITAGHAILLARLEPEVQRRAAMPQTGGLWECEGSLFDPVEQKDEAGERKPRSVRELQSWINNHVKFDPTKADPMLFPDTVQTVKAVQEKAEKIIPITSSHRIQPDARDGQKVIGPRSWERADGKHKTKTCEFSVTGVFVVGDGRGKTMRVCTEKEKCKTHWGAFIRDRAALKKAGASGPDKAAEKFRQQQERQQAEQARREAEKERWEKAVPAILKTLAEVIKKEPTRADGLLASLVLDACPEGRKGIDGLVPMGTTAEHLVRFAAFRVLADEAVGWRGFETFPKQLSAFGLDAKKLLDQFAPVQTSAESKPAAKAKK